MRQKIVAGNWKMNQFLPEGLQLATDILVKLKDYQTSNEIILCPPFTHLSGVQKVAQGNNGIKIGAQNCHEEESGAFTGEVSATMLSSMGLDYVIIGHSERREIFQESDEIIEKKVNVVIDNGLKVIFCCGEPLQIREQDEHLNYVKNQVSSGLFNLTENQLKRAVIAYEPIWAIGTGVTASEEQAQEMHQYIRSLINDQFGNECANNISILYGGSVKPTNAETLFSQPDVDGGLVGGASLNAADFVEIIKSLS